MPISPEAGRIAVEEAADRPYEQAVGHLRRHHSIRVSKDFLEKLARMVGEFWLDRDDEVTQRSLKTRIGPRAEMNCDCCCVFADGTMVHTDGEWHEVRVGTVRGGVGDKARKSSVARFMDVEQFGADLWRKACEWGYQGASLKGFISDGSHWIRGIAEHHFSDAVQILDWYHLSEHISTCSNEVFGEQTQDSKRWAERMRGMMKDGKVDETLEEVERLPWRCKSKRQAKHELITYLTNNRDRVN